MSDKKTYISLFSAAGIGCYGFKLENFICLATVELLAKRIKFQKFNNICTNESQYIQGDLSKKETLTKTFSEVLAGLKENNKKKLDVVLATPPCQGMSLANHKKKNELPRNSLVIESLKIINELKPYYFILENVPSFLKTLCLDIDKNHKSIEEAIKFNLGHDYIYISKKINFANYGSQSSRTRSLTIGVHKDLKIDPELLFPSEEIPRTLRNLIGHLPRLKWDEISSDIYHSFRTYKDEMRPWIKPLKEGMSAFQNKSIKERPHRIIDGKIVQNKEGNGDKYRRQIWDKLAPCVHTRNDILASQNTIHPEDDRVFSIRELMLMMTIPDSFKFSEYTSNELSKKTNKYKKEFLKREELNIRHSIGEAVPTVIFQKIAKNIKIFSDQKKENIKKKFLMFQKENNIQSSSQLNEYIKNYGLKNYTAIQLQQFSELLNTFKEEHAAFYTDPSIVYILINSLPDFNDKNCLRILEPSVGSGNFIFPLIKKYSKKKLIIDVVDINSDSIKFLKALIKVNKIPSNVKVNFINDDFLLLKTKTRYDLAIGNPPFKKILSTHPKFQYYKSFSRNKKTNNIFNFFLERLIDISDFICFILPKSILGAPEFNTTRDELEKLKFDSIHDFGEKAFKGILIETIALSFYSKKTTLSNQIKISSLISNTNIKVFQSYVMDNNFPTWLLYRSRSFDDISKKLKFNLFDVFRDRQITSKLLKDSGKYRVLKSSNIDSNIIVWNNETDKYISDIENLAVKKFLNHKNAILIPNLTYLPRASFLPRDTLVDGSVAILTPKVNMKISTDDLIYWSSEEFRQFYRICRNHSSRSMNIDSNYVFYFGISK